MGITDLSRHRAPDQNVVVEPGAHNDALRRAVLDRHYTSRVSLHDAFTLRIALDWLLSHHPIRGIKYTATLLASGGLG